MYIITEDNVIVVPVDFNLFFQTACDYKKYIRYSREYTLSEKIFMELDFFLSSVSKEKFIAIDMENIVSYPSRMFSALNERDDRIFFYNVNNVTVKQRLDEDIEGLNWIATGVACFSVKDSERIEKVIEQECKKARIYEQYRIISQLVQCRGVDAQLLESSGLYSNYYVNIKKLFTNVEGFYYLIFCLAGKISNIRGVDAFISSSKNGAIIANVLCGLMDIKEVHLIGVGPKYSMELGDSLECIKQGKKYMYIFDFMCTGTEFKIVSALVNSKKARLISAAGIAKYEKDINSQLLKNVHVLADTRELGINYKVVGNKEDIEKLMR